MKTRTVLFALTVIAVIAATLPGLAASPRQGLLVPVSLTISLTGATAEMGYDGWQTVSLNGVVSGTMLGLPLSGNYAVEISPGLSTGAFRGVAARGILVGDSVKPDAQTKQAVLSGRVIFAWSSKDDALQAIRAGLEANSALGEDERTGLIAAVQRALESAAVVQLPGVGFGGLLPGK